MKIGISSEGYTAGKTSLARYLASRLRGRVINFATPIKLAVASILSQLPQYEYIYDPDTDEVFIYDNQQVVNISKSDIIPELGVTLRSLYQTLGTEWGRDLVNNDMWVKIAQLRGRDSSVIIIPDYRFPNENIFNITIRLIGRGTADTHSSECQVLPPPDFTYTNDGSLDDLYRFGDQIVEYIGSLEDASH